MLSLSATFGTFLMNKHDFYLENKIFEFEFNFHITTYEEFMEIFCSIKESSSGNNGFSIRPVKLCTLIIASFVVNIMSGLVVDRKFSE